MIDYSLIKKFVINLHRRPDRLQKFKDNCPLNEVEVIYGFDGKNPDKETLEEYELFSKNLNKLRPGELGCFISHLRIYKIMLEKNYPYALIMEDDAIFCPDFHTKFLNVISESPNDTDILYIGGRFVSNFYMKNCMEISNTIVKHNPSSSGHDADRTTHAYIISNKAARFLLDKFNEDGHIKCPVDHWMIHIFLVNSLAIYNAQPLLCHSPAAGDSDIR